MLASVMSAMLEHFQQKLTDFCGSKMRQLIRACFRKVCAVFGQKMREKEQPKYFQQKAGRLLRFESEANSQCMFSKGAGNSELKFRQKERAAFGGKPPSGLRNKVSQGEVYSAAERPERASSLVEKLMVLRYLIPSSAISSPIIRSPSFFSSSMST